jgi:hypothetical protein
MAHTSIQNPIVLNRTQPLLISRGRDESDAPAPAARRQQMIGAPVARPHGREERAGADAHAEAEEACLPPECWYG